MMKFILRTILCGILIFTISMLVPMVISQYTHSLLMVGIISLAIQCWILYYYMKPYKNKYINRGILGGILLSLFMITLYYFLLGKNSANYASIGYLYDFSQFFKQWWYILLVYPSVNIVIGRLMLKAK